ncbi:MULTISPECIES: zinc dependent phospholipase C family protein [Bacillus cereus group]|uniref:zinc dependent phospholipase C family protein n=1 Tax=Bacillus cereus group TaxID=86661 RepID=UPI000BC001D9|nr:zinc dependent phospholipase C family protein [Bacillus cereus]ASZ65811.1 hydrolase [Bacillus cereus]MCI4056455.1 zinc dependent phospholipase C family protein [Bacillus cereus]MEC2714777.1 zinc dependent phospholipase C family protein [Bacillus cereus]MEC2745088.1 zinc dependent phospholipase C family protein [Bacillus cereus]MEC2756749.1 zinc dependent phospholipase C family protein [Bacillus cereus]
MGSRIMHVIIANGIAEKLSIHDKTSFLLGAVAPDAVHSKKEKGTSHFYAGTTKNYTRRIDYDSFFHKYESHIDSPFILGYYTHLIADDNWLSGFFLPWLKNRIENDETIAPLYYNDFKLLNAKLLHHYDQEQQLFSLLNQEAHIVDIEEVSKENVLAFRKYLFGDMLYPKQHLHEDLQVFTFDQIVGYIETAIEKGVFFIKQLSNEKSTSKI